MSLVTDWIYSNAWAILPKDLKVIIQVAERTLSDPAAVEKKQAEYVKQTNPDVDPAGRIRDGIGILDVMGPIFPRADWLTNISGGTGIDQMARDFTSLMEDKSVSAIILNISSPGGSVEGTSELAAMIYAARGVKPVVAFVGGGAASGAYWIASAASKIYLADTAYVGSIGVIMGYVSTKERDKNSGVKRIDIISNVSPFKRVDPETDAGKEKIQQTVDAMGKVFVDSVAKYRGVSAEIVASDFGQGWIKVGQEAVDSQMADGVSTFEKVLEDLQTQNTSSYGGLRMNFTQAQLDAARAEGVEEGKRITAQAAAPKVITTAVELNAAYPALCVEVAKAGADGERTRIQEIESIKNPEARELVAKHKFDPAHNKASISTLVLEENEKARAKAAEDRTDDAEAGGGGKVNNGSGDPANPAAPASGGVLPKLDVKEAGKAFGQVTGGAPKTKQP